MTRWACPTCGTQVTTHVPVTEPPRCAHRNTIHDAKRPRDMEEEIADAG